MDKIINEIHRGDEANRLLESEIYKESVQKVREGIVTAMQASPMGDEKTHNHLVIALQILGQIERQIKEVANTGKMARLQFEQDNTVTRIRKAVGF